MNIDQRIGRLEKAMNLVLSQLGYADLSSQEDDDVLLTEDQLEHRRLSK